MRENLKGTDWMSIKKISLAIVLLSFVLILILGNQQAAVSNNLSKEIAKILIGTTSKIGLELDWSIDGANSIIRDAAHFGLYMVMGLSVASLLYRSGVRGLRCILLALMITVILAISDELRQMFVPGRGAEVKDVLMDAKGALSGVALFALSKVTLRKKCEEKVENKLIAGGILETSKKGKIMRAH